MKDVIIIGAGVAGLSAAFELYKNNIDFHVLESQSRVGGVIETIKARDYLIETGAHAFSSLSKEALELIRDLGIEDSLVEANSAAKKRYIYCNNQLMPVPSGPLEFFKTALLSKEGKWTIFEELFIKREEKEESVEEFFTRRFGREVLKNIVQPYLNGVFGGDVKKLSVNAVFSKLKELESKYNSTIVGFLLSRNFKSSFKRLTLYSFNEGIESLPREIYERLKSKITLNTKDLEITRAKDFFVVTFKVNNKTINYTTNSILFALPSYKIHDFDYLLPSDYAMDFFHIEYMPIATVTQVVDKAKIKINLDGFGFLCTKEPHRKLLGTIWTSLVFSNRAPADKVLLTSYIGGAHYKKVAEQSEEEIKNLVTKEIAEILQIMDQSFIETLHVKVNPNAIPQYNIGHIEKVKRIDELMDKNYGLFFTGNYLNGVSINDTIKTSRLAVEKIRRFLNITVRKQESLVAS